MQSASQSLSRTTYGNVSISGGAAHLGDQYFNIHNYGPPSYEAAQAQILSSIRFPEMRARLNEIGVNQHNTFEWFFEEDTGHDYRSPAFTQVRRKRQQREIFRDWLQEDQGLFLIQGKPGSGKSTFMKFLFKHNTTSALLRRWSGQQPPVLLFHSFWMAGTSLQSNWKGFLASVITQLVTSDAYLPESLGDYALDQRFSLADWSESELLDLLKTMLTSSPLHKCFFIDGLDEFDECGDFERLSDFLDSVTTDNNKIKICVSSRPAPHVLHYLVDIPTLTLQDLTYDDIYDHAYNTLKDRSKRERGCALSHTDLDILTETICEKSEGVFLWVHYVLSNICRGIISYDNTKDLLNRIDSLPSAMEDLYKQMWETQNKYHSVHLKEAATIFCLGNYFPMPLFQLASALNESFCDHHIRTLQPFDDEYLENYCNDFASRLSARTAGLVEIVFDDHSLLGEMDANPSRRWRYLKVQYFHRTVHDFFQDHTSTLAIAVGDTETARTICDTLWIKSSLTCVVQQVLDFIVDHVSYLLDHPVWPSPCFSLIDLIDDFGHRLTSSMLGGDVDETSGDWFFHLHRHSTSISHPLDYNSLVTSLCRPDLLNYLLIYRGTKWSSYYKGHLLMYVVQSWITSSMSLPEIRDSWIPTCRLLIKLGADLKSVQPFVDHNSGEFLVVRPPAVSIVLTCCMVMLNVQNSEKLIGLSDGIIEILTELDIEVEHDATLFRNTAIGVWTAYNKRPSILSCISLTYKARELCRAVLESFLGQAHLKLQKNSLTFSQPHKSPKDAFLKSLHALPCKIKLCGRYRLSTYPIEFEPQVLKKVLGPDLNIYGFLINFSSSIDRTDFVCDIDFSVLCEDIESYVRPLDPEEEISPDEWKEKGILREYFARIAKSERAEPETRH